MSGLRNCTFNVASDGCRSICCGSGIPPALGILTLNALSAATEVIVPVDMSIFSLCGVGRLRETISTVQTSVNPKLTRVTALCNKTDNTNLATAVLEELARGFGQSLNNTRIRKSVRVGEAQAQGLPLLLYSPKDGAAKDYEALAQEIMSSNA